MTAVLPLPHTANLHLPAAWELFHGASAFSNMHTGQLIKAVLDGQRPTISPQLHAWRELEMLVTLCWSGEPAERPSFDQVVQCLQLMLQLLADSGGSAVNPILSVVGNSGSLQETAEAAAGLSGEVLSAAGSAEGYMVC